MPNIKEDKMNGHYEFEGNELAGKSVAFGKKLDTMDPAEGLKVVKLCGGIPQKSAVKSTEVFVVGNDVMDSTNAGDEIPIYVRNALDSDITVISEDEFWHLVGMKVGDRGVADRWVIVDDELAGGKRGTATKLRTSCSYNTRPSSLLLTEDGTSSIAVHSMKVGFLSLAHNPGTQDPRIRTRVVVRRRARSLTIGTSLVRLSYPTPMLPNRVQTYLMACNTVLSSICKNSTRQGRLRWQICSEVVLPSRLCLTSDVSTSRT